MANPQIIPLPHVNRITLTIGKDGVCLFIPLSLLYFLTLLIFLWISRHAHQSHSSPHPFISTLCPRQQPPPKGKVLEAVVCHTVSSFVHTSLLVMSHWSGLRHLAFATLSMLDPHWDSSRISCWCPMSGLALSHAAIVIDEVDAGGGPTQFWAWVVRIGFWGIGVM